MTDKEKLEKIVAYLKRRMYAHNQKADIGSTGEIFDEKIENAKYEECKDTLNFIDSMQKEAKKEAVIKVEKIMAEVDAKFPKFAKECMYSKDDYTDEDRKVLCDGCEEKCAYGIVGIISTNARGKENIKEEPVSEEVWEASKQYALRQVLASTDTEMSEQAYLDLRLFSGLELAIAHKDGAQWQKEQMMANTADAMIGLPYENKDGGYTHLIDVSRPLPVGNNKIAIIFNED